VGSSSGFTVNWGDGTSGSFGNNVRADKKYNFNDLPESTLTPRGYRQAIVTVTISGTQTNLALNLGHRHAEQVAAQAASPWLDIRVAGDRIATFSTSNGTINTQSARFLESCEWVGPCNLTSAPGIFWSAHRLQRAVLDLTKVTSFQVAFANCHSLRNLDQCALGFSNVTSSFGFNGTFTNCNSLERLPPIHVPTVANMNASAFLSGCSSLGSVAFTGSTANLTSIANILQNCASLRFVEGLGDLSGATSAGSTLFTGCASLRRLDVDLRAAATLGATFAGSIALSDLTVQANVAFSVASLNLSRQALVNLFNGLNDRTGLTAVTLTITGNPGTAQLTTADRAIATGKNWTLSG
jgi:hypothetical protein